MDNEISIEKFNQLKAKYHCEMDNLTSKRLEMSSLTNDIATQLEFSLTVIENLSEFYSKADTAGKQQILGSIFTDNLVFSEKKVRTKSSMMWFRSLSILKRLSEGQKKDCPAKKPSSPMR